MSNDTIQDDLYVSVYSIRDGNSSILVALVNDNKNEIIQSFKYSKFCFTRTQMGVNGK